MQAVLFYKKIGYRSAMFTGIIRDIGTIRQCENQAGGLKASIATQLPVAHKPKTIKNRHKYEFQTCA